MFNLSDHDIATLEHIVKKGTAPDTQRAKAVLLAAQGKEVGQVSASTQLTTRQVNYWLKQYADRGFDIFPKEMTDEQPRKVQRPHLSKTDKIGVSDDDPMSEAGRKVMAYYLARLLAEEENVRNEAHGEAIHDMRVATRRLRSALDIFGPFYRKHVTKMLGNDLRKLGRSLGAVRDLEVVRDRVNKDIEALGDAAREEFQPLLDHWDDQLATDRQELLHHLDGGRYTNFLDYIVEFVSTPEKDAVDQPDPHDPTPYLVRHIAPVLIYEQYEAVRAYEPFLTGAPLDTLHALRIEAKRLRYRLEAFEEILTPEAKRVIGATKALQDHLGALQDTRVATGLMQDFIRHIDETQPVTAILQYLATREDEKQQLLGAMTESWQAFAHPDIRRAVSRSVSLL